MTRQDFINDIECWYELIDFCNDEGCYECEDIYDSEQRDDFLNEEIEDIARNETWREMLETLQGFADGSGYDYYIKDNYGDFVGLDDDDFDAYKSEVLDWGDRYDIWDDDEEGYGEASIEPEDVSINDLISAGVAACQSSCKNEDADIERFLTA